MIFLVQAWCSENGLVCVVDGVLVMWSRSFPTSDVTSNSLHERAMHDGTVADISARQPAS